MFQIFQKSTNRLIEQFPVSSAFSYEEALQLSNDWNKPALDHDMYSKISKGGNLEISHESQLLTGSNRTNS